MKIGNREFDIKNRTYIMGILNITPDSFSDGGKWNRRDKALYHAEVMIKEGVDIIDIGGESTRPGYTKISCQEEISRVLPIIDALKNNFDIPVSIDTYKSQVAEAALTKGAHMVNDIWGLKDGRNMAPIIAKYNVACCLVHNRNKAKYENFITDILKEMQDSLHLAQEAGIPREKILVDPGIGFGKTYEMNLQVLSRLEQFKELGYPILLGASRKGFIGQILNLPEDQRVEGTIATTVLAVMKGCAFVRVHDVKENKRAIQMAETIFRRGETNG